MTTSEVSVAYAEPPEFVRATFGVREDAEAEPLTEMWVGGWRYDEVVLSPVVDHARAAWSAKIRESLEVTGVRLARPLRSTDGRYVVSGWRADTYLEGRPEARYDEVLAAAQRLHQATLGLPRPRFLAQAQGPIGPWMDLDLFVAADRMAWDDDPMRSLRLSQGEEFVEACRPDGHVSLDLIDRLGTLRKTVSTPPQLVHGDLFGTVLFNGDDEPGLTDITPYWRPGPWAAGVAVVDAVSWGSADDGLIGRWDDLREWPQMLLRAVMFRLAVHALHPRSTPEALPGLMRTAEIVRMMV